MPDVDRVNAVITKSETIQARYHKGNAAALHHLFVEGSAAVDKLFTTNPIDMRIALDKHNIFLTDEQIQTLCAAGAKGFFKALLAIQQAEIKHYVGAQPHGPGGGLIGTTPGYYNDVMNLVASSAIHTAQDYVNALKRHSTAEAKPGEKEEKKPKGQLMQIMNREYVLYAEVRSKDIDYGSKADNVRYHYYKDVIYEQNSKSGTVDDRYETWQEFVAKNDSKFPGGFHIQVDTVYEKKGHVGHVKDPRPAGKGHHISIVNLGMSNEDFVKAVNDRNIHCHMHDVQFTIGTKKYGIYLVDGKPLTFYKAELDSAGQFKRDASRNILKSELKASESANLKEGGTQLLPPFDKVYSSVTHAIAHSIKQMKDLSEGLEPTHYKTPVLTSGDDPKAHGFKVGSGHSKNALEIGKGAPAAPVPALNIGHSQQNQPQATIAGAPAATAQATIGSLKDKTNGGGAPPPSPDTLKFKL